jgi:hypothetical protein
MAAVIALFSSLFLQNAPKRTKKGRALASCNWRLRFSCALYVQQNGTFGAAFFRF